MKKLMTVALVMGLLVMAGCSTVKSWPREQATQLYDGTPIDEAKDAVYLYRTATKTRVGPRNMAVHAKIVEIDNRLITEDDGDIIEIKPGHHRVYAECSLTHTNPDGASPLRTYAQGPRKSVVSMNFEPGTVFRMRPERNNCPNSRYSIGER